MTLIFSFPPVASPKSKVLILGSMPGEASLRANQYYAHPRNAFWPIMDALFGAGLSLPYQQRLAILDEAGIAMWDSLQACMRSGSLDSAITDEVANDFVTLFARYPNISHVYFNGAKAASAFRRHVLPALTDDQHLFARLPSTSPAHASMNLDAKIAAWRVVAKGRQSESQRG